MEKPNDFVRRYALIIGVHLVVIAIWHGVVVGFDLPSYVIATPLATLLSLADPDYPWMHNLMVTAAEIFGGYLLGVAVGVGMALAFSWFRLLDIILMPLVVSLNMIPKVALGPIMIVWFSYGIAPNILIAFSICFLPVLLTTARGLHEVDPDLVDLVRTLKASRWQIFKKIQLPGSLPYVFSGMKVAVVLAVAGAVVGELIQSEEGLGYLIMQVQVTLDTAAMFMAVLLITLVGVVLYGLVLGLERLCVVGDSRVE